MNNKRSFTQLKRRFLTSRKIELNKTNKNLKNFTAFTRNKNKEELDSKVIVEKFSQFCQVDCYVPTSFFQLLNLFKNKTKFSHLDENLPKYFRLVKSIFDEIPFFFHLHHSFFKIDDIFSPLLKFIHDGNDWSTSNFNLQISIYDEEKVDS